MSDKIEAAQSPAQVFTDMCTSLDAFPKDTITSFKFRDSQVTVFRQNDIVTFQQGPVEIKVGRLSVDSTVRPGVKSGLVRSSIYIDRGNTNVATISEKNPSSVINGHYPGLLRELITAYEADSNKSEVKDGLIGAISEITRAQIEANRLATFHIGFDFNDRHDRR